MKPAVTGWAGGEPLTAVTADIPSAHTVYILTDQSHFILTTQQAILTESYVTSNSLINCAL